MKSKLAPAFLVRKEYDWQSLKDSGHSNNHSNLDVYAHWQSNYKKTAGKPDWGEMIMKLGPSLSIEEAKGINEADYVNNTSIPIFLEFRGEKIMFCGDLMEEGWKQLLKKQEFSSRIEGTTILIASHHGHVSGFSVDAMKVMGNPKIAIVSAHRKDESVDGRYSKQEYISGIDYLGNPRRMFSTRSDGSIQLTYDEAFSWQLGTALSGKLCTF